MPQDIKEKQIFSRLKKRDKEAFTQAYDAYLDSIYRFIYFKVGSQEVAEDITSQVFLKTWDYIQNNNLRDYKTLKALLYKVARNTVIDHYRKESRKAESSLDTAVGDIKDVNIADPGQDILTKISTKADYEIVVLRMRDLKDEYREAIVLRYINELNIKEIAVVLDKSRGNVRVLIYRALQALKELVEDEK
ncbi:RNA polymerase sigma factor [Candidatus Parcubacteria bacterium]|nr:RNA polymerase sigma factor [Candidatus Parcubacteria bacterium]